MNTKSHGYWRRLRLAMLGRDEPREPSEPVAVARDGGDAVALSARVATLESEMADREARITAMQAEYKSLQTAKDRATSGAGQEHLEMLFKRLAGPLANLSAMTAWAEAGQEVETADLIQAARDLEKELNRAGLTEIGRAGEEIDFDLRVHQTMSGGGLRPGDRVVVRLPGYRTADKVLLKALVTKVG